MYVNDTNNVNYTNSIQSGNVSSNTDYNVNSANTKKTEVDTVTISNAARSAESKWQDISDRYDMTNISGTEVMKMAQELYDHKFISATEMFDMYPLSGINDNLTVNNKRNHLDNMEKDLNMMKQFGGNTQKAIDNFSRVVDMLKRIG